MSAAEILDKQQNDWWDEIDEEQQRAIDKALCEMKNGEVVSHEEVMKKYADYIKL